MAKERRRLGEILIDDGLLSEEALQEALAYQKTNGGLVGQVLLKLGHLEEDTLTSALGRQLKMPYLPLNQYAVNMESAQLLDEEFCRQNFLVVFDHDESKVCVAVSDPLNDKAFLAIEDLIGVKVHLFLSTITEILDILDLAFANQAKKKAS
jgi:type IV pilus assembly protein PilB